MSYFKDVQTCDEHGFALSPDGDCVRCRSEALASEQRLHALKLVSLGAVGLVTMLGLGTAWARMRTAPPVPVAATAPPAPAPVAKEAQVAESAPPPPLPTHDVNWEMAMARAEAEREVAAAAPQAPEQAPVAAPVVTTTTTYVVTRQRPRVTPPTPDPTDAWWNEGSRTRMVRTRGVYSGNAAAGIANAGAGPNGTQNPAAWGLPPNRGGYFTTKGGH